MMKKEALVDSMPGLTRDRREGIIDTFGVPVRIVDTAGWESFDKKYLAHLEKYEGRTGHINRKILRDMII